MNDDDDDAKAEAVAAAAPRSICARNLILTSPTVPRNGKCNQIEREERSRTQAQSVVEPAQLDGEYIKF